MMWNMPEIPFFTTIKSFKYQIKMCKGICGFPKFSREHSGKKKFKDFYSRVFNSCDTIWKDSDTN